MTIGVPDQGYLMTYIKIIVMSIIIDQDDLYQDHYHEYDQNEQVTFLEFRLGRFLSPHVAGCPDGGMLIQEGRGQVDHDHGDDHDVNPEKESAWMGLVGRDIYCGHAQ